MNIQINIENIIGRNIELVFGHARIRVELPELKKLVSRATKYKTMFFDKQRDIVLAQQEEINKFSNKSEYDKQVDNVIAFIHSGYLSKLHHMQKESTEQLPNYIIMLTDDETKEMLRRISSKTLMPLLRYFRDIGENEAEIKITNNMATSAAQVMRNNLNRYKHKISDNDAHKVIMDMTDLLEEMDKEGLVSWEPNILQSGNPDEYQLIFGQTSILLSETETYSFLEQAKSVISSGAQITTTSNKIKAPEKREIVFDDLIKLDDRYIQLLLREVSSEMLIYALKGTKQEFRNKIYNNMSVRSAEILIEDLKAKGPVRISEAELKQNEILNIALKLAAEGQIYFD